MSDEYAAWRDLHCDRCGSPADVTWVDVRQFADPGPREVPAGAVCSDPACRDAAGFTGVRPAPSPQELAAQADRMWLERHRRLSAEGRTDA